jgi:hypothetical protein
VPPPERLIKGGLPTEAMVARVLVTKYAWHLPLYRQAQMLLAQGIGIKRAILAFWVGYAAAELKPLYLRFRELILASVKIAIDETVVRCSIPAAAAPRKDTSGRSPVMTAPAAGAIRPPSPTATRQVAAQSTPSSCSRTTAVSCNAMDMQPTRTSPMQLAARRSHSPSAGRIYGAGSSTSPRMATFRSPVRHLSVLRNSM